MKAMLKISILLNFLLLCGLLLLLAAGRRAPSEAAPPEQFDEAPSAVEAAVPATSSIPAKGDERPFNWSQVESSDYNAYIANMRSIGCPEQTIRDIVTADVDSLYASRRQPLEHKMAASSFAGRLTVEGELRELRDEEAAAVSALLVNPPAATNTTSEATPGISPFGSVRQDLAAAIPHPQASRNLDPSARELVRTASDAAAGSPLSRSVRQEPPATISLPLVLQDVDPPVLKLNSQQAQFVNNLRQKFIEEVGGPDQDPNDPAYSQCWQASQPQADLDLRGMIGIRAWEAYQIAAWAKANEQPPSGP